MRRFLPMILGLASALCAPSLLSAQKVDVPEAEVFGGYSWYHAGGTVNGVDVPNFNEGWGAQFAHPLNQWAGLAVDASGHYNNSGHAQGIAFGPQFKLRGSRFTPFAEFLVGFQNFAPKQLPSQNTTTYSVGGGLDVRVNPRFSLRFFQLDYTNTYYTANLPAGQTNNFNGVRLQTGVVLNLGLPEEPENLVSATCRAIPEAVNGGEPVKLEVTAKGFLPKRTLSYKYLRTGGTFSGNTMTVDTTGLEPGSYKASAEVVDNGKGKHQQRASCEVAFSVNAKRPPVLSSPVLSLSADPASVKSGDVSTITASASSADNRPLSYNCTSTGGRLSGNGPSYMLETAGLPDSTITVDCTASDDRNLSASASTSVKVYVPAAVTPIQPVKFGTIKFDRDAKRPTRVDNEAKGELDRYADALAASPDSKGVVVGYESAAEAKKENRSAPSFAALRAVNSKDYVAKEKGVDAARVESRTGSGGEQKTELWIVPAGAKFAAEGTAVVDEGKVKAVPRVALKARKTTQKAPGASPKTN